MLRLLLLLLLRLLLNGRGRMLALRGPLGTLLLRLRLRLLLFPLRTLLLLLGLILRVSLPWGLFVFLRLMRLHHDGGSRQCEREQKTTDKSAGYSHEVNSIAAPLTGPGCRSAENVIFHALSG